MNTSNYRAKTLNETKNYFSGSMQGSKKLDRMMSLERAKLVINPGDILFYEGISPISWAIRAITSYPPSKVSHIAMVGDYRNENGDIVSFSVIEFREFKGGREVGLDLEVAKNSGRIHVFRPSDVFVTYEFDETESKMAEKRKPFESSKVVRKMRQLTGLDYNWRMVFCTYMWKMPILRMFICNRFNILASMVRAAGCLFSKEQKERMFKHCGHPLDRFVCSTAIDYSFTKAGYDLICKSPNFVTPDDLFRSPHLHYVCTITIENGQ